MENLGANKSNSASVRSVLFATAELAKNEGNPDWVQFAALIYGLASVLKTFGSPGKLQMDLDWTALETPARLVSFDTMTRQCGLESAMASWTSSEYMYRMLKHNNCGLPDEGFKLLKLGALVDWHTHGRHDEFSDDSDEQVRQSVADFHGLCERARRLVSERGNDFSDSKCDALWHGHYSFVVRKYTGTEGNLSW